MLLKYFFVVLRPFHWLPIIWVRSDSLCVIYYFYHSPPHTHSHIRWHLLSLSFFFHFKSMKSRFFWPVSLWACSLHIIRSWPPLSNWLQPSVCIHYWLKISSVWPCGQFVVFIHSSLFCFWIVSILSCHFWSCLSSYWWVLSHDLCTVTWHVYCHMICILRTVTWW